MNVFFGILQMVFRFLCLLGIVSFKIFSVSSPETIELWNKAAEAVEYNHCYWYMETIKELNSTLSGKVAPADFLSVHQLPKREWESDSSFQERLKIPQFFCEIGWEGTLFLMIVHQSFNEIFASNKVPPLLHRHLKGNKDFLTKHFVDIQHTAQNGQLGPTLCFIAAGVENSVHSWQLDFINGFFKYCQKEGFTSFAKYVFDHSKTFFTNITDQFLYSLRTKCIIAALRNPSYGINPTEEIRNYQKLHLRPEYQDEIFQQLVDALYCKLAEQENYELMDEVLDGYSWPQPSTDAKEYAMHSLNQSLLKKIERKNYLQAREMFGNRNAYRPSENTLHAFVVGAAQHNKWDDVDDVLENMYSESIRVPQHVTDFVFIQSIISENPKHFQLITGTYHLGYLTGEQWIYGPPSPAAFDTGLLEAVKYRHQGTFDVLLDEHGEHLSESGSRAALEQAGRPTEVVRRADIFDLYSPFDLYLAINRIFEFDENHYQQRLKRKLGIPTNREELISITTSDSTAFQSALTQNLSSLYVPVDAQLTAEALPQQLDYNDAKSSREN
ncbi:MAG: hypothetical protein LW696_03350 [Alphaproteobacteria bacterium]|jgi:hypothetical protein|nr:hypothetical protein [Alphaproteobacteria bacterium]